MKCDLHHFLGPIADSLPTEERQSFRFSASSFGEIPSLLETKQLVITKGHHDYGGASRVDALSFFAQKDTYRELGLLVLAVVFRPGGTRIRLALTNPASNIQNLVVEYEGLTKRGFAYRTKPDHFLFFPGNVDKHPWIYQRLDLFSLPTFKLTNVKDSVVTDDDWAQRDTVVGFGNDDGSVQLAELLLRFGSPQNQTIEIMLEGEGGFRGVGRFSAEAYFHLPGSSAWPSSAGSGKT